MALDIKKKEVTPAGKQDYGVHLESTPIISSVSIEKKMSPKDSWTGTVGTDKVEHPGILNTKNTGCSVSFLGSRTFNLGHFESAKAEIGITVPCDPESINAAYTFAQEFVDGKMTEIQEQIEKDKKE